MSDGSVTIRPGTLYAALDRLSVEGLVALAYEEPSAGGRPRRYYRLTTAGADALRAEAERRQQIATLAIRRLSVFPHQPGTSPA
jgi:DNA-binding PadR family transcriptional regulator